MRRYAVVGTGGRSGMYIDAITGDFSTDGELVALCDRNIGRARLYQQRVKDATGVEVPVYTDDQFDVMLAEQKPDRIVVTTGP
ncbi:MAG TPA: Gfo/Idh/MocA family oxidoreductase, partial [Spirochaetia bacterium]|nr:Gfo/Idh/MocA family oxidoreductase [Spirochaetia bacterium]